MMLGGGEREGEWEEILLKSLRLCWSHFCSAEVEENGEQSVSESEGLFFFQGFQHTFRILHNLFFSPLLCLSIA